MMLTDLRDKYSQLAARDQRILRIGAIAVAAIVLLWIFLPLQRKLVVARQKLETQHTDLQWMRSVAPTLAAAGPAIATQATGESLVVLIDRTARESGLGQALTGSQPASEGSMRVQLERADFNLLTGWISRLASQHGVRVESASVTAQGEPGLVNVSVQLRAPR
jgi:general secretion pathway protein M